MSWYRIWILYASQKAKISLCPTLVPTTSIQRTPPLLRRKKAYWMYVRMWLIKNYVPFPTVVLRLHWHIWMKSIFYAFCTFFHCFFHDRYRDLFLGRFRDSLWGHFILPDLHITTTTSPSLPISKIMSPLFCASYADTNTLLPELLFMPLLHITDTDPPALIPFSD